MEHELERYNGITEQSEIKEIGRSCMKQISILLLRSYNTIVAIIHKADMQLYDFSRYVYGYTATTAQHIAKFCKRLQY